MMDGLAYVVPIVEVSMADTGVIGLLTAPADSILEVDHIELGTRSVTSSERQTIRLVRASSAGTGGRSVTPNPLMEGYSASGATFLDDGTPWSAQPSLGVSLPRLSFDLLGNYVWHATKAERIVLSPSGRLAIEIMDTPGGTRVWNGFVAFREKGG